MSVSVMLALIAADPVTELRTLDDRQREMVMVGDIAGLERIAHPKLQINAPAGQVLDRASFFRNMRSGAIGAEAFTRTAETVSIAGDVGVVMGRETFTPTAASEPGRLYGANPLERRYTNINVKEGGGWKWLARHANVVPQPAR